jgi:flagellar hook protein FlgE
MIGSIGNNLSALKAFGTKMDNTAKNIANINTDDYKKTRAELKENSNGGVKVDIKHIDTPGPTITTMDGNELRKRELSNVDLTEEMSEMITTKHGYTANLKAVETQNEMLGDALDIVG